MPAVGEEKVRERASGAANRESVGGASGTRRARSGHDSRFSMCSARLVAKRTQAHDVADCSCDTASARAEHCVSGRKNTFRSGDTGHGGPCRARETSAFAPHPASGWPGGACPCRASCPVGDQSFVSPSSGRKMNIAVQRSHFDMQRMCAPHTTFDTSVGVGSGPHPRSARPAGSSGTSQRCHKAWRMQGMRSDFRPAQEHPVSTRPEKFLRVAGVPARGGGSVDGAGGCCGGP